MIADTSRAVHGGVLCCGFDNVGDHMNWRARWAVTAALLLCGCVESGESYPGNWAAPVRLASCADVAGLYRGTGERAGEPGSAVQLYLMLIPETEIREQNEARIRTGAAIDRIEIAIDRPNALVVRFRDATRVIATMDYPAQACGPDGVVVETYSGDARDNQNPLLGHQHEMLTLSKAADGALLVRRSEHTAGSFVPVSVSNSDWTRFPAFGSR